MQAQLLIGRCWGEFRQFRPIVVEALLARRKVHNLDMLASMFEIKHRCCSRSCEDSYGLVRAQDTPWMDVRWRYMQRENYSEVVSGLACSEPHVAAPKIWI